MTATFELIDQNKIQKKLNLNQQSRVDGANDNYKGSEINILSEIRTYMQGNINSVSKELGQLEQDFLNNEDVLKQNGYKDLIKQKKFEWEAIKAINEVKLINAKNKTDLAQREIKHFKLVNDLTREPQLKSKLHKFFSLSVIVAMFIFETTTNSNLLSEAVGGFRSGISIAIVFASFNIIASFLIGRLVFTNFSNINKTKRRWNYSIFALYSIALIYFNLILGVFRGLSDQIGIIADSNELRILVTEAVTPLDNLGDISFMSMALICLGILFSIIAIVDGYFFDENYPGYAKYGRRLHKSEHDLEATRQRSVTELKEFQQQTINTMENIKSSRWKANFGWGLCIEKLQKIFNEYEKWIVQMAQTTEELVLIYRKGVLKFAEFPPTDYLNYQIENGFPYSAHEQWPSLSEEYASDEEKHQRLQMNIEIITSEHSVAVDAVNNFFKDELNEIKNYIRKTHEN